MYFPLRSRNISTACSGNTPSPSPEIIRVGDLIAFIFSAVKSYGVVINFFILFTKCIQCLGSGASLSYSLFTGVPSNICGVMPGNIALVSGDQPSYLYTADVIINFLTTSGCLIASCQATTPPRL